MSLRQENLRERVDQETLYLPAPGLGRVRKLEGVHTVLVDVRKRDVLVVF